MAELRKYKDLSEEEIRAFAQELIDTEDTRKIICEKYRLNYSSSQEISNSLINMQFESNDLCPNCGEMMFFSPNDRTCRKSIYKCLKCNHTEMVYFDKIIKKKTGNELSYCECEMCQNVIDEYINQSYNQPLKTFDWKNIELDTLLYLKALYGKEMENEFTCNFYESKYLLEKQYFKLSPSTKNINFRLKGNEVIMSIYINDGINREKSLYNLVPNFDYDSLIKYMEINERRRKLEFNMDNDEKRKKIIEKRMCFFIEHFIAFTKIKAKEYGLYVSNAAFDIEIIKECLTKYKYRQLTSKMKIVLNYFSNMVKAKKMTVDKVSKILFEKTYEFLEGYRKQGKYNYVDKELLRVSFMKKDWDALKIIDDDFNREEPWKLLDFIMPNYKVE